MSDRTPFLLFGRRFHDVFRSTIENGDGREYAKWQTERPFVEHYACGMYLSGCLAYLEGKFGPAPWNQSPINSIDFDSFLQQLPEPRRENLWGGGVNIWTMEGLVCIRNAFIHNNSDLSLNRDQTCLQKITSAQIPGVQIRDSTFRLVSTSNSDFMELVRLSFIAVAHYHGET